MIVTMTTTRLITLYNNDNAQMLGLNMHYGDYAEARYILLKKFVLTSLGILPLSDYLKDVAL